MTNCKNCGAPLHGAICEYCGTNAYGSRYKGEGYCGRYKSHDVFACRTLADLPETEGNDSIYMLCEETGMVYFFLDSTWCGYMTEMDLLCDEKFLPYGQMGFE